MLSFKNLDQKSRIGYSGEVNSILLTYLKKTLEPNHENILEILREIEEYIYKKKKAKCKIETRVKVTNKTLNRVGTQIGERNSLIFP